MKVSYTALVLAALACSSYAIPTGKRQAETSTSVEGPQKKVKTDDPSTTEKATDPKDHEFSEFSFPELPPYENSEEDVWRDFPQFDSLEDIFTPEEFKTLQANLITDEEIDEKLRQEYADLKFPEVPKNMDLNKLNLDAGQVAAEFGPKPGEQSFSPAKPSDSAQSSTAADDLRDTAAQQYRAWSEEAE